MKNIRGIQIHEGSNEELLPGFSPEFPYIASRVELDRYPDPATPWHWHRTVELFYMERGTLEYTTPKGTWTFPAGSGGFVNSNILHASRVLPSGEETIELLHLFEPEFLSGVPTMDEKYIRPITSAPAIELIPLSREQLHITPLEYLTDYRLRKACRLLADTNQTITQIAYACSLGSSSYFGKLFRERYGCTPAAYRRNWQDRDKITHK